MKWIERREVKMRRMRSMGELSGPDIGTTLIAVSPYQDIAR